MNEDLSNEDLSIEQTPPDQATEQLAAAVESAIGAIQERLTGPQDLKWSVSDLLKLVQLRKDLRGDIPRSITVRWVH